MCNKCGNEMRIFATYKNDTGNWKRKYVCDFCGEIKKVKVKNPKG